MEYVHFRATWNTNHEMFNLKFQLTNHTSPMVWDIKADEFLKMVERAELQLVTLDGQNRLNKSSFHLDFIDKRGNECEVNLEQADKDIFRQMTAYLRKVYDSWKIVMEGTKLD